MTRRLLIAALVVAALITLIVLLASPDPPSLSTRVELGGYPNDIDMARLVRLEYTAVIALLDPAQPHERVLLEREQRLAQRAKLRVISIPMRDASDTKAADAAAELIRKTKGRIYVHSYLGVHRLRPIAERIGYPIPGRESGVDLDRLARARDLIRLRQYGAALDLLDDVDLAGATTYQLRGEANLGLGVLDQAASAFRTAIIADPRNAAALAGLGYVFVRQNEIDMAREALRRSLAIDPKNEEAREVLARL